MFKRMSTNTRTIGKLLFSVVTSIVIVASTTGLLRMAYALDTGGHSLCWDSRDEHMGDYHTSPRIEPQVESVVVIPGSARLAPGEQLQFHAEVCGASSVSQDVRWSVSEPASLGTGITAKGLLTIGKDEAPGDISVYAVSVADSTKMCEVRVTVIVETTGQAVPVTGIALNNEELSLTEIGQMAQLVAMVEPNCATNKFVLWSTSDDKVVTVSQDGLVTAVGNGSAVVTATTEDGGYKAVCVVTVSLPKASISGATVVVAGATYTGAPVEPEVSVTLGSRELVAGTDYDVEYSSNVNAGTATVRVAGKGNYEGVATQTFLIARAEVAVPKASSRTYNGKAQVGVAAGEGYALSGTARATDAGSYEAYAAPDANHCWPGGGTERMPVSWKVSPKSVTPSVLLAKSSYAYTGKAVTPVVTVKAGSTTLRKDADYTVSYASGRKNVGTYKVSVTLKGNYKGSGSASFSIVKAANPMTAKAVARAAKYSDVKKKAVVVACPLKVSKAEGKATYAKASGSSSALTIDKTSGKVTVKKGTKKGTYTIKVKVSAAGNANYKAGSKTVTCKVAVK